MGALQVVLFDLIVQQRGAAAAEVAGVLRHKRGGVWGWVPALKRTWYGPGPTAAAARRMRVAASGAGREEQRQVLLLGAHRQTRMWVDGGRGDGWRILREWEGDGGFLWIASAAGEKMSNQRRVGIGAAVGRWSFLRM